MILILKHTLKKLPSVFILEVDAVQHVMVFLRQSMAQSEHTKP